MSILAEQGAGLDPEVLRVSMRDAEAAFDLLSRVARRFDDVSLSKRVWQAAEYSACQTVGLMDALWAEMNREGESR